MWVQFQVHQQAYIKTRIKDRHVQRLPRTIWFTETNNNKVSNEVLQFSAASKPPFSLSNVYSVSLTYKLESQKI